MKRWSALLPLGLFAALIIALGLGLSRDPRVLPSQLINKPFPEFSLNRLDGDQSLVSQNELLGEVSLVNVFGSWCTACLYEHPLLMELSERSEIRVIGINWRDEEDKAKTWLNRYGNPYDVIVFDPHGKLIIDLGITGAPETFLVDADGRIRYKHVGPMSEELWKDTLRPIIMSLGEAR